MQRKGRFSLWRTIMAVSGFFILVSSYQNCGKFKPGGSMYLIDYSSQSAEGEPDVVTPPDAPAGSTTAMATWDDAFPQATLAPDCLTNQEYNFCVALKDPVTANGQKFTPALDIRTSTPAIEAKIFNYGVRLPESGPLKNKHFVLRVGPGAKAVIPTANNDWKHPYAGDSGHLLAQMSAWYWINYQRAYMVQRTGEFYFSNRAAGIYGYRSDVANNAYFNQIDASMNIGFSQHGGGSADVGLDAAVNAHEAGHGNLYFASNRATLLSQYCASKNGCFGGIHEGVGDIHAFILFPSSAGSLGNYFTNSVGGLRSAASYKIQGKTAQSSFSIRNGEIHDMGEVYASIWWEVWSAAKSRGEEKDIEVIFTQHLKGMSSQETFTTAYSTIQRLAKSLYPAKGDSIADAFRVEYQRVGVALP